MSLLKSCADHVRAYHASLFSEKLKASHAHEIVAAALGYKTAAAMKVEKAFPVEDLLMTDYLLLDVDMVAERMAQLSDLPVEIFTPVEFAVEIGNFLRFELGAKGRIALDGSSLRADFGIGNRDELLLHEIADPLISVRSLLRLARSPQDPPGLEGSPFHRWLGNDPSEALQRSAIRFGRKKTVHDAGGHTTTVTFDVAFDRDDLQFGGMPTEKFSPWYRLDLRVDRHGGRTGYRLSSALLSNGRNESLDLLLNRAAPNISNPFDNPDLKQLEDIFDRSPPPSYQEALEMANGGPMRERTRRPVNMIDAYILLPAGTTLMTYGILQDAKLFDGRPYTGKYVTHGVTDTMVSAREPECRYRAKREAFKEAGFTLPETMSWSDALIHMNKWRVRYEPVGTDPRKFYVEGIERMGPGKFLVSCGT